MSLFSVPFNFEVVYSGTSFILNYDNNTNVYYYLSQFPDNNIIIVGKDLNSDPIILTHSEYQSFINRGYNIINPMTVIGNNIYLAPMISKRSIKYDKKKNTKLVTKKLKKWIMKGKFDDVVSHFKVVNSKNKKTLKYTEHPYPLNDSIRRDIANIINDNLPDMRILHKLWKHMQKRGVSIFELQEKRYKPAIKRYLKNKLMKYLKSYFD